MGLPDRMGDGPRAVRARGRKVGSAVPGIALFVALGSETVGEIFKYDMDNDGARTSHVFPTGQVPGEPVFVPAEGGTNEDDGYLMTYVHDETTDTSHLTILDASDMAADPIAEVHLPRRIPTGFHGSWIAD